MSPRSFLTATTAEWFTRVQRVGIRHGWALLSDRTQDTGLPLVCGTRLVILAAPEGSEAASVSFDAAPGPEGGRDRRRARLLLRSGAFRAVPVSRLPEELRRYGVTGN